MIIGVNAARILRSLWTKQTMSRVDLAAYLQLDKSTVSKIVGECIDCGLLLQVSKGDASPQGGRKPIYLAINPAFGAVLGVEIQTEYAIAVLVDMSGRILFECKRTLPGKFFSVARSFTEIYESLQPELQACGIPIIGAAIGTAGIINPYDGIIYRSTPLHIKMPQELYSELDKAVSIPVLIDNDANCGAWGEIAFPEEGRDPGNFVYILAETRKSTVHDAAYNGIAVGASIGIENRVMYGRQYSAGEFRSLFRSGEYINQFSVSDQEAECYEDDPHIFEKIARELSRNIALIVNMLNLDTVILGGRIEFHPEILNIMQEEIDRNWSYDIPVQTRIRFSDRKENTIAYGAAGMFLEHLFSVPDISKDHNPLGIDSLRVRAAGATDLVMEV
ncbi:ROK family transcriptional regulator [Spirochaeta dissipatitropha]